jgi:hypothetical protein
MDSIVQLRYREYKKLAQEASYNQNEIERLAREMYEQKGAFKIELEIKAESEYNETISFEIQGWVSDYDRYELSYKDKKRIIEYGRKKLEDLMQRKFGRQINDINLWNSRLTSLRNWKWKFIGLTVFGWFAALALLIINFLIRE